MPPIVIESDGAVNVLEGANATFSCHIASEPTHITTHWLYNDQLLASNEKHVITGNGTRMEMEGKWNPIITCNASVGFIY